MTQREEQAFRDAFEQRTQQLPPTRISPPFAPRRDWGPLIAVAAVVALIVGGVAVIATERQPPAETAGSTAGNGDTGGTGGALPRAASGWKWVSNRGAAVQVPVSWAWGQWPDGGSCGSSGPGAPKIAPGPFVALDDTFASVAAVGCARPGTQAPPAGFPPQTSPASWQPAVRFHPVGDRTASYAGWTLLAKPVGVTGVSVIVPSSEHALGQRILDSARTFSIDQNGCPATSPVASAGKVRPPAGQRTPSGSPRSASICQYARAARDVTPGLIGSRRLDATQATALAAAIQAAPQGPGPDYPGDCLNPTAGNQALLLRMRYADGSVDSFVYVDSCVGNGIDDGRSVRQITAADCRPLYAQPPIRLSAAHGGIFQRCVAAG